MLTTTPIAEVTSRLPAPTQLVLKFISPIMAFDSPQQHVAALVRFVPFITGVDMISELYGDGEESIVYDLCTTMPGERVIQRR